MALDSASLFTMTYSITQPVENFCALYAVEIIQGHPNGTITARTARGALVRLPRYWIQEKNSYEFHITQWINIIRDTDAGLNFAQGQRPRA